MCDNTLELVTNPYSIDFVTELHPDPTYDSEDGLPWWIVARNWMRKAFYDISNWFSNLHWAIKLFVDLYLLAGAIILTVATGGGAAGVISILVQVAIGIGIGIGMYALGALFSGNFSWTGLANAALDAFFVTSAFVFVSASVNAIKYACRTTNLPDYSPEFVEWLNKGEANNTVYKAFDANNQEVYTGITRQSLKRRYPQHIRSGKQFNDLKPLYEGLTRNQARSIETYKILTDGTSQVNKILSISKKHRFFEEAMMWAKTFIGG